MTPTDTTQTNARTHTHTHTNEKGVGKEGIEREIKSRRVTEQEREVE